MDLLNVYAVWIRTILLIALVLCNALIELCTVSTSQTYRNTCINVQSLSEKTIFSPINIEFFSKFPYYRKLFD